MAMETIIGQCEEMSDTELIRAMSIEKDTYTEEFFTIAEKELKKRGVSLSEVVNAVKVRLGERFSGVLTIDEALRKLDEPLHLWEMIRFTNCLGQKVAVQQASLCWSGMVLSEEEMDGFLTTSGEAVRDIVRQVLLLGDWKKAIGGAYDPDEWTILSGEEALGFVNRLCQDLAAARIPASLKIDRDTKKKSCQGESCKKGEGPLKVIVRREHLKSAEAILNTLRQEIEKLYQQIERLPEGSDRDLELSLYNELFELAPEDETVAFNRGVILYENESFLEAADSFIVSAFNRNDPEIREESASYLEEILTQMPDNVTILHTLASLAMEQGDAELVLHYYKRIIELDPNDPVANLNLGHFYFTDNRDDALAKKHFEIFLSIDPESDEADEVRQALEEIG